MPKALFFDPHKTDARAQEAIQLVDDVVSFLTSAQMYLSPVVAADLERQYVRGFTDPIPGESYIASWTSILEMFDLPQINLCNGKFVGSKSERLALALEFRSRRGAFVRECRILRLEHGLPTKV
ncbi:hypothetical protein [Zhongshania marina]|nr:hypothetical protein [Marortus luteolus]